MAGAQPGLRGLLAVVAVSLVAVVAALVALIRSGRAVGPPDLGGQDGAATRPRRSRATIP